VLLIPKRHGQTDRQTDGRLTVALPRSALASRGKNFRKWLGTERLCILSAQSWLYYAADWWHSPDVIQ